MRVLWQQHFFGEQQRAPAEPEWYLHWVQCAHGHAQPKAVQGAGKHHVLFYPWISRRNEAGNGGIFALTAIIQGWRMFRKKDIAHQIEHPEDEVTQKQEKIVDDINAEK